MTVLENITATTEPFELRVGVYTLALTGSFNGATATLERRVPNRPLWDHVNLSLVFTKPGAMEFDVVPNSAGEFRLRIDAGDKLPKLSLVVAP